MRIRSSLIVRWLEPLASALWAFFIVASIAAGAVWGFEIGDRQLAGWTRNVGLLEALTWLLGIADITWITLAAANIYLSLAETEGLLTARRWAVIVGGGALVLGGASVFTGFPLGAIQYSRPLGVKIGPVPIGLALLWLAIILGARETALRIAPRSSHAALALGTGVLTFLTDLNLEPLAAKLRGFWFWRAATVGEPPHFTPPLSNYAAWLIAGAALTFFLHEENVSDPRARSWKPIGVFAILNLVFLAAHAGRWLRP